VQSEVLRSRELFFFLSGVPSLCVDVRREETEETRDCDPLGPAPSDERMLRPVGVFVVKGCSLTCRSACLRLFCSPCLRVVRCLIPSDDGGDRVRGLKDLWVPADPQRVPVCAYSGALPRCRNAQCLTHELSLFHRVFVELSLVQTRTELNMNPRTHSTPGILGSISLFQVRWLPRENVCLCGQQQRLGRTPSAAS